MTEYGLIVALITVVSVVVIGALGDQIHGAFCTVETALAADGIGTASTDC